MAIIKTKLVDNLRADLLPSAIVLTPDSADYAEGIKRWATSAERPAALVVYPTSAEDVSKIVRFSTAHSLDLAICGGGHSTGGSSSSDGGISINLAKMRAVVVDVENKTVSVEGGALWKNVDEALGKHGLAVVGGTVNHTGVGGLTLGGGYGWLTPKYGLTIDNLLSVNLVLASGEITTASATQNTDLFWAARGAGAGFGVATKFIFQAHDQKNTFWGGMMMFPPAQLRQVFEASNLLTESDKDGKHAHGVGFASPPPAFETVIAIIVMYNGSEEDGKKFCKPLLDLKPLMEHTSSMPYEKVNGMVNDLMPFGLRRSMKGSASLFPISIPLAESVFQDYQNFKTSVPNAAGSMVLFEPISPRKILEVPQTATAFANRGKYFNVLFSSTWTREENDGVCREWGREMAGKMDKFLREGMKAEGGAGNGVGQYANYDSFSEKGEVMFGVNFPRLKELKKRYDPGNVFGKGMNLLG